MENYYFKKYRQVIRILSQYKHVVFPADRQLAVKDKILAEIRRTPQMSETLSDNGRINLQHWSLRSVRFALVTIVLIAVGTGTSYAAASAQPGDLLYSVKLLGESAELQLSISDESKAEQLAKIAERRLDENHELQIYTVEVPESDDDKSDDLAKSNRKLTAQQAEQASVESRQRFEQAMESLKKTQAKLEQKGNQAAAEAVRENLKRLEERSQQFNRERENSSEDENSGQVEGVNDRIEEINNSRDKSEDDKSTNRQEENEHEQD